MPNFVKVGDRIRYIVEFKMRSETWPKGVWLEPGIEGAVTEYHPPQPEIVVRGERFEFEVSPEEAWQHCVEGKFRNALVCVWETPVYRVYENISRLKGEFAGDPEMQKKLQVVEGFFKNK